MNPPGSGTMNAMDRASPTDVRAAIRRGEWTRPTAGLAPGFTQANLVVLPEADAFAFLRFCLRNPKPCPVLEVTDPGSPEPADLAPGADLRTDLPALPRLARRGAGRRADRHRGRAGATTSSRS